MPDQLLHERHNRGPGEGCTGSHQCRIFTQTMTGYDRRRFTAQTFPQVPHSHTGCQHDRLRIHSERQLLGRAFGDHGPQVFTQRGRRFIKRRAHHRRIAVSSHHADRLGALTGKYESERHRFLQN